MDRTDKNGYNSEILLCFSRGAESRRKILEALRYRPKNCNQIAQDVKLDWWTAQRHLRLLLREHMVESTLFGNSKYYRLTQAGKEVIRAILSNNKNDKQAHASNASLERLL
ncbi:MAG: winged helix-turn-helix domain-containing protein [Candidatus Bathyarchaeia archaeon]